MLSPQTLPQSLSRKSDMDDRKGLDLLTSKIAILQGSTKTDPWKTPKSETKKNPNSHRKNSTWRQSSLHTFCIPTGQCKKSLAFDENKSPEQMKALKKQNYVAEKKRRPNPKIATINSPKISGWLQAGASRRALDIRLENKQKINKEKDKNHKIGEQTSNERKLKDEKLKSPGKEKLSKMSDKKTMEKVETKTKKMTKVEEKKRNYEKYGVRLPTFSDIVKTQKNLKSFADTLNGLTIFEESLDLPEFSFYNLEEEKKRPNPKEVLGCEHLSRIQLRDAFHKNLDYISEIYSGKRFCDRHERFKRANHPNMSYNTSMVVFSKEQKLKLAKYLQKKFSSEPLHDSQYYFNVLLPELCLKIFMDEHNMSYDEAVQYLDQRPVD